MPDLLLELFSEEIPARMQARAADDLKRLVTDGLVEAGLTYASAGGFATPRRLVLSIEALSARSPDTREERRGPRVSAPDKAIEGFLRGAGLAREDLSVQADKKGDVYVAVIERAGQPAAEIVADVVARTIRSFPWPKSMRWGDGALRWVRPLHSILCLLSDEEGATIVPVEVGGIVAGNTTEGHRFMAPGRFAVRDFDDFRARLRAAHVVLSAEERADAIWHDAQQLAFADGLEIFEDKGLLAEVAGLVEWPVVLMGRVDETFKDLPVEVLQTSMKEHQKFFTVRDPRQNAVTRFITVANRDTEDDGATILEGNERVLRSRLGDALFFYENDTRVARAGMGAWIDALSSVTFHAKLGSQADRVARIVSLAAEIAPLVEADADRAATAARLAKADLASEMVYEFPELQGVMGRYYIGIAGHDADVAAVASDHYAPLGPSDAVPTAPLSVAVALADKLDMLTGFWAIDEKPTGSGDPFALRRAALGVIRIVLENGVRLQLRRAVLERANAILVTSLTLPMEGADQRLDDLLAFFHDRLKVHLRAEGIRHDVIDACLAMPGSDDLVLVVARARALQAELATEEGENLIQGFKRAANILSQAEEKDGVAYEYGADAKFFDTDEERALGTALNHARGVIDPAIEAEDFAGAMAAMAALRGPIDAFFEAVQVNAENQVVRRNRLNLLNDIRETCLRVADLTRLEG